jgi:hypothetical protein
VKVFPIFGREIKKREPRSLAVSEATAWEYLAWYFAARLVAASHSARFSTSKRLTGVREMREAACGLIIRWLIWSLAFHVATTIRTYSR